MFKTLQTFRLPKDRLLVNFSLSSGIHNEGTKHREFGYLRSNAKNVNLDGVGKVDFASSVTKKMCLSVEKRAIEIVMAIWLMQRPLFWFAWDIVNNKSLSLRWELNFIFMQVMIDL